MRQIDADDLVVAIRALEEPHNGARKLLVRGMVDCFIKIVNDSPTIEPKRGKWVIVSESAHSRLVVCDSCNRRIAVNIGIPHDEWSKWKPYCDQCGADMREEQQ